MAPFMPRAEPIAPMVRNSIRHTIAMEPKVVPNLLVSWRSTNILR